MIKKHKWKLMISSLIILLPVLVGVLMWDYLPEQMITHWNVFGEADGKIGRSFTIWGLPIILLIVHWICILITVHDPKNKDQSSKVFSMVIWILPIVSLIMNGLIYAASMGNEMDITVVIRILFGLMFIVMGNYMPKCKQNHTIGVKVTWALRNEENWNKTHRFTGKIWVIGGFIILLTTFLSMEKMVDVFVIVLLVLAFAPILYSYIYYRKQLKAGTASKDDKVMTSSEKKITKNSITATIIILVLAGIFLFTGEYDVIFKEDAFTIDARYWDDATVKYADIDEIEYREQDDSDAAGSRTFGYGSFTLLMGKFTNDEFGAYTRYSYMSCDSCVVLTVGEEILVINGKDEEQTKEIYEKLLENTGNE